MCVVLVCMCAYLRSHVGDCVLCMCIKASAGFSSWSVLSLLPAIAERCYPHVFCVFPPVQFVELLAAGGGGMGGSTEALILENRAQKQQIADLRASEYVFKSRLADLQLAEADLAASLREKNARCSRVCSLAGSYIHCVHTEHEPGCVCVCAEGCVPWRRRLPG